MPVTRTLPTLGLPYLRAAETDIRKTFARFSGESKQATRQAASCPDPVSEQIDLYEFKAAWCDAHGFPADAMAHRAYVAQLRRMA